MGKAIDLSNNEELIQLEKTMDEQLEKIVEIYRKIEEIVDGIV